LQCATTSYELRLFHPRQRRSFGDAGQGEVVLDEAFFIRFLFHRREACRFFENVDFSEELMKQIETLDNGQTD
jgi:hypothetical protein